MTDFDLEDLSNYALQYENETIRYAYNNPQFEDGMMVKVYHYDDLNELIDVGVITRSVWDPYFYQWCHDIQTTTGTISNVLAGVLERVAMRGNILRACLRVSVIKGGIQ